MKAEYDFSKGERGAVIPQTGKTRLTIYIDDEILEAFREMADNAGIGYQTMMKQALREYLAKSKPLLFESLHQVIPDELHAIG
ncbi:MAG: BrnA antitoxin family protein [Pseudomonadota bacterium]